MNATEAETSVEIQCDHQITHKIDRLSLLPNELLDHIFDLAYSIDAPSTGALWKRLLLFHITGLYRRIYLTKSKNIIMLMDRINRSPNLGESVLELRIYRALCSEWLTFDALEVGQFFGQLVRLQWLDLGGNFYGLLDAIISMPSLQLPRIRHITSSVCSNSECPLLEFSAFPTLRSLSIIDYNRDYGAYNTTGIPHLPLLTHLSVSGLYADDLSIASFCALCPSLTRLSLNSNAPYYSDVVKNLPAGLLRLDLASPDQGAGEFCERQLSRFTHLRHLVLDDGVFTSSLPSHLLGLRALATLELGEGRISTQGMLELFINIPINRLKLDLTTGKIGYRLEVDENGSAEGRWVPGEGRLIAGDWVVPKFNLEEEGEFTLEGTREMVRAAEELGIEVEGSIVRAIDVMDAYYLEIANLAIYRCFRDKTSDHYLDVLAQNLAKRLPPLDLDTLDPTRVKIRKIELEEEGWFALTLGN